jgi:hypothetical protein
MYCVSILISKMRGLIGLALAGLFTGAGAAMKTVRILIALLLGMSPVGSAVADGWKHYLEVDPITDFKREYAGINGEGTSPSGQTVAIRINIGCGPEGLYVSVHATEKTETAIFRVDSNQPIENTQFVNFDDAHFGGPTGEAAKALTAEILEGKRLVVRRQALSAVTQTTHTVDISRNKQALRKAIKNCS